MPKTHPQRLTYQEVLAALPTYAAGKLDWETKLAIDDYLNSQVELFQQLDAFEAGEPTAATAASTPYTKQMPKSRSGKGKRSFDSTIALADVMEGEASPQQLPNNPLLMRKAPQRITDQRTGQRFIVPRAEQSRGNDHQRKFGQVGREGQRAARLLWGVLAVAAVGAMLLIGQYQLRLQQRLASAEAALTAQMVPPAPQVGMALSALQAAAPAVTWLTTEAVTGAPVATLLMNDEQGLLLLQNLPPLAADQRYQLWLVDRRGALHPGATFASATPQQTQWVNFTTPLLDASLIQVGVSVEATQGGSQPSGPFILTSQLAQP